MRIVNQLSPTGTARKSAVAMGFFDGVHLGHRAVLSAAAAYAEKNELLSAAFTFSLPAGSTLKGGRILSLEQKAARMSSLGIEWCMEPPFAQFCALSPEQFVQDVLCRCFAAQAVFCGDDFTFGAHAAGNVALLHKLCAEQGIAVHVVKTTSWNGGTVSSTRIRAALEEGRMEDANAMLGQPYAIDWAVVHGQGLGSALGVPTLNQNYPQGMLLPCGGVYLTRVLLGGTWHPSATGIGNRPTVAEPGAPVTCETYVPDYAGNLYGSAPTLEFHRFFEPTRKYDTLAQLKACILGAAEASKAYFARQCGDGLAEHRTNL